MRELFQRKKGGVWWCEYYNADNRRIRRSTRLKDRRAAELKRRQYEREAHDPNRATEDAPTPVVSKVLDHFVNHGCPAVSDATLSMYVQKAGHLQRLVGDRAAEDLQDISIMQGYIKTRIDEGAKHGTIYKELVTMRQALYAALEAKHIQFDPRICFPRFRARYVPKERWLTPDEAYRLLLAFERSPARQMWIVVALYTGARDSEVDALRWEDIDWRTRIVTIRGTKTTGANREIPLQPVLAAVLMRSRQASGYVVGEWHNVRRCLHDACEKHRANMAPLSPNDLRRTFATWMANLGASEMAVARMLGHGSSQMVRRVYAKLEHGLLRREILKLSGSCATGVPDSGPDESPKSAVSQEALSKLAEILMRPVLGVGIEPTTRGFSVRAPSNKYKKLDRKSISCTTGEPAKRRAG